MASTEPPIVRASPLPLGFLGLFTATTILSAVQLKWLPATAAVPIGVGVLSATVGAQLLAAIVGFASGDTVAGTSMGILAGTWAAVAITSLSAGSLSPSDPLGVVLLCSAAAMLVPAAASGGPPIRSVVMATTSLRFAVTGIAELTASTGWMIAAGIVGLILAAVSLYAALALATVGGHGWRPPLTGGD